MRDIKSQEGQWPFCPCPRSLIDSHRRRPFSYFPMILSFRRNRVTFADIIDTRAAGRVADPFWRNAPRTARRPTVVLSSLSLTHSTDAYRPADGTRSYVRAGLQAPRRTRPILSITPISNKTRSFYNGFHNLSYRDFWRPPRSRNAHKTRLRNNAARTCVLMCACHYDNTTRRVWGVAVIRPTGKAYYGFRTEITARSSSDVQQLRRVSFTTCS